MKMDPFLCSVEALESSASDNNNRMDNEQNSCRSAKYQSPIKAEILEKSVIPQLELICDHFNVDRQKRKDAFHCLNLTNGQSELKFFIHMFEDTVPQIEFRVGPKTHERNNLANWNAGQEFISGLKKQPNIDLKHFREIQNMFSPNPKIPAEFCIKTTMALSDQLIVYRVNLNPNIQGSKKAVELIQHSLNCVGLTEAWKFLENRFEECYDVPNITCITLDLSTATRVEIVLEYCSISAASQFLTGYHLDMEALKTFTDNKKTFLNGKPVLLRLKFDSDQRNSVPSVKIEIPIVQNSSVLKELSTFLLPKNFESLDLILRKLGHSAKITSISFGIGNNEISCTIDIEPTIAPPSNPIPKPLLFHLNPYKTKTVEPISRSTKCQREIWIKEAKFNLVNLKSNQILMDFLTDSGTGAMSARQTACLITADETYAGASSFDKFRDAVEKFTGFKYILPVHQGRAAERILFQVLVNKGDIVPNNGHFDTTRANITLAGGDAVDMPYYTEHNFGGNMNLDGLRSLLLKENDRIPFVMLTLTNNIAGGQPVSMGNVRETKEICMEFGKRLFIDSGRIAENAMFIKLNEEGYQNKSISKIICEILSHSDGMTMSAKKNGLAHVGGWIAVSDEHLAHQLELNLTVTEGFRTYGGLAGRDLEAIAQGLEEIVDENYLNYRIYEVARLGQMLDDVGIPVQKPFGGHAIYVDAKKLLPDISQHEFPAQALAVGIYIHSGIRTFGFGKFFHGDDYTGPELVRLAIPRRVYDLNHFHYVQNTFKGLVTKIRSIKGLTISKQAGTGLLRHFNAELECI